MFSLYPERYAYIICCSHYTSLYVKCMLLWNTRWVEWKARRCPMDVSNVPQSPAYGVYVSQLIRYAHASSAYSDFLVRSRLLTGKLLGQGYNRFRLITNFKKFYGRHYGLIGKIQLSVTDLFLETLFLQWHGVAGPFTARPLITYIDIMYLCLLQPVYILLNLTFTDFDVFIACGRCH